MQKKILVVTSTGVVRGGEYVLGNYVRSSTLQDDIVLMGPSDPLVADYFRSLPIVFIPCRFLNSSSALKTGNPVKILQKLIAYLLFLLPFVKAVMMHRPSIVMGNISGDIIYSAYAKLMGKKFVLGIHEEVEAKSVLGKLLSLYDRFVDKYIAVSKCVAEQVALCTGGKSKIIVIYNGITPPINIVAKSINPSLELLFIGDLEENKNPLQALEIASCISRFREVARIRFVYKNAVGDIISKLKSHSGNKNISVEFLNSPPRVEIDSIIRESDFLIISSRKEAFPLVTLEALSLGTPIIANCVGGLPEIIRNKENGFLFSTTTIAEIVEEIGNISSEYYTRLSISGIETISRFTHSQRVEDVDHLLNIMV